MLQNVFFIDDDKPTTIINERLAKRSKLFKQIHVFNASKTALDLLIVNQKNTDLLPDIIFLDVNMPVLNGWDFLEAFNQLHFAKKISIVMLSSASLITPKQKEALENLVYNFESKPLTIEKIKTHTEGIST